MIQLTLFDNPVTPRIARDCDPSTSHQSATATASQLGHLQAACAAVLGKASRPMTANEVASECVRLFGRLAESYRKRLHELVLLGEAVEYGERSCEVTGKPATVFRRPKV